MGTTIDDTRTRILLDNGANVSMISAAYAKRLRLREVSDHGRSLEARGINPGVLETRRRTLVKITLGWERVYEFEMWIMEHSAGVDVVYDWTYSTALPDYRTRSHRLVPRMTNRMEPKSSVGRPRTFTSHEVSGESSDCTLAWNTRVMDPKDQTTGTDSDGIPQGKPVWVRLTNVSDGTARWYKHSSVVQWILKGELPREVGYVRLDSRKYNEWQGLAYAEGCNLLQKEKELYECWLAEQPPAVERQEYTTPTHILARPNEDSVAPRKLVLGRPESDDRGDGVNSLNSVKMHDDSEASVTAGFDEAQAVSPTRTQHNFRTPGTHIPNEVELADYAHELAFLPDLTEPSSMVLDYTGPNVMNKSLGEDENENSLSIRSGAHVDQTKSTANAITMLKKNGVEIRLCIDYKRANAVTTIMEYAMPLVDDLLTDMDAYLWFYSLDAASGFWAVMMTERAQKVSAFVCPLEHFGWRRMPFGLKNAPMIYQRMMDNALWGFVQPKVGWKEYSERSRLAQEDVERTKIGVTEGSTRPPSKFEADRKSASNPDPVSDLANSSVGDTFTNGEPDESSLVPVLDRRSVVDDICFGSETFDGCLSTLDRLLRRFTDCRISVSFTTSIFVQSRVDFLSHEVSVRFIQDFAVYAAALYQLKEEDFEPGSDLSVARQSFAKLQQKIGDAPILRHFDRQKEVHVTQFANEWALSSTFTQEHDGKMHPVRFCGRVLKEAEMNYGRAEKEVQALLLLLKTCYTQLAGCTIQVYTRFSTLEWVHTFKSLRPNSP
ncbi:LOW QUALITY PROTEIN: hypothetical protein PHMEG_00026487 [Phytophthora megakarya]|uniref:Reverse transcriptase n=1 Tax=Phytophthora megakarya TaxID=4795 RepID=A0A225V8B1_9STRA|nr:LOW QUALITY PROTEIN: hypothetical protein PHMEG_00026487 [Phytophthora megakarya]